MDSKRWWCLLSKNHSILNLRELFRSEKYRVFAHYAAVAIWRHSPTMGLFMVYHAVMVKKITVFMTPLTLVVLNLFIL